MGNALGVTGLSVLSTIAFVVAAILSIVADNKLKGLPSYNANSTFQAAHNNLTVAIIFGWVAAGITFILMLGYLLTSLQVLQTEWLHLVLWILAVASSVIAFIYLGLAMRKVDNTPNDNGTQSYILWSMILTGIGLVILVFMGLWRMTHHATKAREDKTAATGISPELMSSQYMYINGDTQPPPTGDPEIPDTV